MTIEIPVPNSPDALFEQLWLKCKKMIGSGSTRDVYEIPGHEKVLKVSTKPSNFTNWNEIVVFHRACQKELFAEITSWSSSGKFLVMERLASINNAQMNNYRFPLWLTDRKPENLGIDKSGNIKAMDYALISLNS